MAGNKNSGNGGKVAKKGVELVQRTRAAILNSLDVLDNRNKPLSQLLADAAEQNPIKYTEMIARHIPKDVTVNHKSLKAKDISDDELYEVLMDGGKLGEFVAKQARELHDKPAIEGEVLEETGTD
jgi:hypothetical protein